MENDCKVIDFSKPKGYKTKEWVALEKRESECKGKIEKWKSAGNEGFVEVRNGKLYNDGFKVVKYKNPVYKNTEYRYGKYNEKEINSSFINEMTGILKPFKITKK